jgi:peptidyl-prolyl cis-trans isomerase SurA
MRNKLLLCAATATVFFTWAAKDPILMTVNGEGVKLSEFEYLYHKNNQQQLEKESLDQYLQRFEIYKLKVADAKAAGIDTTAAFKKEFDGYANDLAKPYLEDSTVNKRLAREAYERMQKDVNVSHLMLALGHDAESNAKQKAKLDSLRKCILAGQSFEDLAVKYSADRSAQHNKGDYGFIVAGRYPYQFDYACYNTPVGKISQVFETPYGFHIVRVNAIRPTRGKVLVEHIMKLFPRNASDSLKDVLRGKMDSIYNVVKGGANFEDVAKKESGDPGSASRGGLLPWFGAGEMVQPFDSISFALPDSAISKPFESPYGIHIIKKLGHKGIDSYEQCEKRIMQEIQGDERASMARDEKVKQLSKEYSLKENKGLNKYLAGEMAKNGGYDSTLVAKLRKSDVTAFSIANTKVPVSVVAEKLAGKAPLKTAEAFNNYFNNFMKSIESAKLFDYAKAQLPVKYPEYGNLMNEYRDGMMLFEISNRKVWEGASNDTKGLEEYFKANKDKYQWSAPKFKGTLVYTKNDSVSNAFRAAMLKVGGDTALTSLKKQFKNDIRIERVLVAKGENPQVDNLVFGAEPKVPNDKHFKSCVLFDGKTLDQPEEANDVIGLVTNDYQGVLETRWIDSLKAKYPVVVNQNVLKLVK